MSHSGHRSRDERSVPVGGQCAGQGLSERVFAAGLHALRTVLADARLIYNAMPIEG